MKFIVQEYSVRAACLLAILLTLAAPAFPHASQVEPIVVEIRPQKTFLAVTINGNGEDVIQAVEVDKEKEAEGEGFNARVQNAMQQYVNEKFQLAQGGVPLKGKIEALRYWNPDDMDYTKSRFEMVMRYPRDPQLSDKAFKVTSSLFDYLPNAQTIVSIRGLQKTIAPGATIEYDPSAVAANLFNNIKDFTILGFEHILTGPDHVLFILALLLVSTSFWPLAKTLTGFTIAHSITLVASALGFLAFPSHWTEVLVALSIIYVGLENIFLPNIRHRFWVASAFGLIHGFGFSYILHEIGLPDEGLGWCLLSFNLGVEFGQIAICAVAFPLMLMAKKRFDEQEKYGGMSWNKVVKIVSWLVVAAGTYWMMERLLGIFGVL